MILYKVPDCKVKVSIMSGISDFRLVKPIKKFSNFYNETVFEVPCNVISISNNKQRNMFKIQLEIVNFNNGKLITVPGYTYKGSIELFNEMDIAPPFRTTAIIRKKGLSQIVFIVYGLFVQGIIEDIFNVAEILQNDEDEILEVFHSHYTELNQWLKNGI